MSGKVREHRSAILKDGDILAYTLERLGDMVIHMGGQSRNRGRLGVDQVRALLQADGHPDGQIA